MKYLLDKVATSSYVYYRSKGKGGKLIHDYGRSACFAELFNGTIAPEVERIEFYGDRPLIPYTNESIERWLKLLNELGFPCKDESKDEKYNFVVETCHYQHKLHFLSTLMLIRLLTETLLVVLPDQFFKAEDEDPKCDRFKLLQDVHWKPVKDYLNTGHLVTYAPHSYDNKVGRIVTRDELTENFEASKMPLGYIGRGKFGYYGVNQAWWGGYVKPKPEPEKEAADEVMKMKVKIRAQEVIKKAARAAKQEAPF